MKIPKKASKPLLEEIQLSSPQYKNEILPELVNSVRTINLKELLFRQIFLVNNETLSAKYIARRQKMVNKSEEFAFLRVPSLEKAKELVDTGIPVSSELSDSPLSALGNPKMGLYLSKFLDYSSDKIMAPQEECVFIMCKVLKGKWKSVVESESLFDPTYDFDSHVSKSAGTHGLVSSIQNYYQFFVANQIFLFEYNQDMETEKYPSNVLPFAVLCVCREVVEMNMSSTFSPLKSISVTTQNPSLRPLKPLSVWKGKLRSDIRGTGSEENNILTEDSVLVSFYSRVNPVKIPDTVEVSGWLDLSSLPDYFSENLFSSPPAVSGISQVQDLEAAESMFYAYFQLLSQPQIEEIASNPDQVPRSEFVEHFHNPLLLNKAAAASLGDSYLYLLPPGEQVQRIGLTNGCYNPPVIHCLLVSSKKVYNTCSPFKVTKVYSNEYVVFPPSQKDIAVEHKAFKATDSSQEVQNSIAKVCNFAMNKQLAEANAAPMDFNFNSDVYTNTFDICYFSTDIQEIPIPEVCRLTEKTLLNAKELLRSHEKYAEQRERAAKQRELEEMRAQVASIEESHRRNVEKEMATNQSFLPRESGLQRSFKKKSDSSQTSASNEKAPKLAAPIPQIRKSVLSSRNNNDPPPRVIDPEWKNKMLNAKRIDQAMPLFETSDSPTDNESGYADINGPSRSKPSSPQYNLYPRKAGGLLDMPLPPVLNPRGSSFDNHKPVGLHSDLQAVSDDDMDISQSPNDECRSSNGEPHSKYMKSSNSRFDSYRNNTAVKFDPCFDKNEPCSVKSEAPYPPYLDDPDIDGSPIAPPVIMEDSPVKVESGNQLGESKRNRFSESEDDHPTLDGFAAPPSLRPVNLQSSYPQSSSFRSNVGDADSSNSRGYRGGGGGIDIDLSGKTADLPDAPYAKPERPHYKVEDHSIRTNKSLAFVVNDSVPKRSDFPVKTIGDLTEYAHDRNDYASRHSEPPTIRQASQNPVNATVTVLTNAMGQRIDISDTRNNAADNPYKPPPSWRPEDPAEMCKNLTCSFFKGKLNRIGRPTRSLNSPRFKGLKFVRNYVPNHQAMRQLDRLIGESERRAERRRSDEATIRERLESDMRSRNAGDDNFEMSTEDEMRKLQNRLGKELRNDAFDAEEERYLNDMLTLNLGYMPQSRRHAGWDSDRRGGERSYSYDRERDRSRHF